MRRCVASPRTCSPGPVTRHRADSASNRLPVGSRRRRSPPPTVRSVASGSRRPSRLARRRADRLPPARRARYFPLDDTSLASLADAIGVELDARLLGRPRHPGARRPAPSHPNRSVGRVDDRRVVRPRIDRDRPIGQRPRPRRAGVARVWPEHFDLGTDVEVAPGRRCNLGASPGDEWHPDPYLYVGPWGDERPGDDGYWNAPFGAAAATPTSSNSDSAVGRGDRVLRRRHPSPASVERT